MHLTPCRDHGQCSDIRDLVYKCRAFFPFCGRMKPFHEMRLSLGWFSVVMLRHQCPSGT